MTGLLTGTATTTNVSVCDGRPGLSRPGRCAWEVTGLTPKHLRRSGKASRTTQASHMLKRCAALWLQRSELLRYIVICQKNIPELWISIPLVVCMKTYLKTNCSFDRNCLLSGLRLVTAPLLTCVAVLFISVTSLAVASGLSANADEPRRTFVTSTAKAPPQVQYMVVELGGGRANDITESGHIVGSGHLYPGIPMPHSGSTATARRLISAHYLVSTALPRP